MRTKQENVYRHRVTGMLVLFFITHLVSILHRRVPLRSSEPSRLHDVLSLAKGGTFDARKLDAVAAFACRFRVTP
jgi:hypothetical protein